MVSAENTDLFLNDQSMKEDFFEEYPSSLNIEIEEFYSTSETFKKNDEDFNISSSENDEIYKGKKNNSNEQIQKNNTNNNNNINNNDTNNNNINNNDTNNINNININNSSKKKKDDNLLKRTKVHGIKFCEKTINLLLEELKKLGLINQFIYFIIKIKNEVKEKTEKKYNLDLFQKNIKQILKEYSKKNGFTQKDLNEIEKLISINKCTHKNVKLINQFLNEFNLEEIIKISIMSEKEFEKKFNFKNKFLLKNTRVKNKDILIDFIKKDVKTFLNNKKSRSEHSKND